MRIVVRQHANTSPTLAVVVAWLAPLVIVLAAWLAYRHGFDGPFIFDDEPAITKNKNIRHLWPLMDALRAPPQTAVSGRPVVSLTLAINYAIGKYQVYGYHLFNLLGHMITGLALYGVLRQTFMSRVSPTLSRLHATLLATCAAAAWVVHPLTSDTVLYISNRTELLMGMFALLTLYCSIRSLNGGAPWLWNPLAITCCLLGMWSKESMAALPLLVIIYDWVITREPFPALVRRRRWLYLGLLATWIPLGAVVFSGARSSSVGFNLGVKWWEYLFAQAHALLVYLRLSFWPHPLSIMYDDQKLFTTFSGVIAPGSLIVALLIVSGWALCKRHWIGLIGAWFFLILAPSSSVVPLVTEFITERRMYAPLAGIVVLVIVCGDRALVWLEQHAGLARPVRMALELLAILAACAAMIIVTDQRTDDFRTVRSIYEDAVRKFPDSFIALNNLGMALDLQGESARAIQLYRHAIPLRPASLEAHENLGVALARSRQYAEAKYELNKAMEIAATSVPAYLPQTLNDLAYLLATCPDPSIRDGQTAVRHVEKAIELGGADPSRLDTLAAAYAEVGRFDDAVRAMQRAIDMIREESGDESALKYEDRLKKYQAHQPHHEP